VLNATFSVEEAVDIMRDMNDLAKAQGRTLGKAFWEIPPQPGSILDVPETAESRERVARLRKCEGDIFYSGRAGVSHRVSGPGTVRAAAFAGASGKR